MSDERLRELYSSAMRSASGTPSSGCPDADAIEALVLGRGSEEERLATLDHVMTCDACRTEFELLRSMSVAARELDADAPSRPALHVERGGASTAARDAGRGARGPRRWMPLAIAAALLVAVGVPVARLAHRAPDADALRGTGGAELHLVSPVSGTTVTAPQAVFVWHAVRPRVQYVLELMDADGRVVATRASSDTVVALSVASVPSGSYDWWVRLAGSEGSAAHSELRRVTIGRH